MGVAIYRYISKKKNHQKIIGLDKREVYQNEQFL